MKELKKHLTWYRLRDPGRPDNVYGDEIADEQLAFQRAAKLAGFYQQPIEVCKVVGGRLARPVGHPRRARAYSTHQITSAAGSRGGLGLPRSAGSAAPTISPLVGLKKCWAIAVGTIADSTTTVTSSEN